MATDMTKEAIIEKLKYPTGKLKAVIDTDAYNEVDDQFAIAWALSSPERLDIQAIYAAPYCSKILQTRLPISDESLMQMNHYAATAKNGMERSYQEILNLFALMGKKPDGMVFRGSEHFMKDAAVPVESDAAKDLVRRSMQSEETLYVIAIGAITNVVSAILMEPAIINKISVIWLGGQPLHFASAVEFNLMEDPIASKIIFDCKVPLTLIPCMTVSSHLTATREELEGRLIGKSRIGSYLGNIILEQLKDSQVPYSDRFMKNFYLSGMDDVPDSIAEKYLVKNISWSRIIWDISTIGYLLNPNWTASTLVSSPILTDDLRWEKDSSRHPMRICHYVSRDHIFGDLFDKLANFDC